MKVDNKRNTAKEKAKDKKGHPYKRKAIREKEEGKDINIRYLFVLGFFLIAITFIYLRVISNEAVGLLSIGIGVGMFIETFCRNKEEDEWQ